MAAEKETAPKGVVPVTVKPLKLDTIRPELLETDLCWYGSLPNAPLQNINIAGVNFVRETHSTRQGVDGQPDQIIPKAGNLHRLSRLQVEQITKDLARYVIRINGARPDIFDVTSSSYSPSQNDVPVAKYIYFCRIADNIPWERDAAKATPMC